MGISYPSLTRTQGRFKLEIEAGEFQSSGILVVLGCPKSGKTTFMRLLSGLYQADDKEVEISCSNISHKPQKLCP